MDDQLTIHFKRSEFACRDNCGFDLIDMRLVNGLELLRKQLNRSIRILSGCRCEAHNKAIGGAKLSQHLLGKAADIHVDGLSARQVYDVARNILEFHGFGVADSQNFVHLDVRDNPARWAYSPAGSEIPWYDGIKEA